jgi:AraC-like DNA-binding protein
VACPYQPFAPPPSLREHLLCAWTIGPHAGGGTETVLPDGSVDVVWREGSGPVVAGPDTGPLPSARRPGTTIVGVSFRPGAAPSLLGLPADALRDQRVPLTELWGDDGERLEDALDGGSASARLRLLGRGLRRRLQQAERPDELVLAAVSRLSVDGHVRALAEELGISDRQLRRRFHAAVGYGPKTLARVLRFQRMLALARQEMNGGGLAQLALDAGYSDQAHMTTECTRLGGAPPARLLAERYLLATR